MSDYWKRRSEEAVKRHEARSTEELHRLYGESEPARAETDAERDAVHARFTAPVVTRRADGSYTAGPPPDGRSVDEHLRELATGDIGPGAATPMFDPKDSPAGLNAIEDRELRQFTTGAQIVETARAHRVIDGDTELPAVTEHSEAARAEIPPNVLDSLGAKGWTVREKIAPHGFTIEPNAAAPDPIATGLKNAIAAEQNRPSHGAPRLLIAQDDPKAEAQRMTFREESAGMPKIDRAASDHSKCTKEPCSAECDGPVARRKATDRGGSAFRKG